MLRYVYFAVPDLNSVTGFVYKIESELYQEAIFKVTPKKLDKKHQGLLRRKEVTSSGLENRK